MSSRRAFIRQSAFASAALLSGTQPFSSIFIGSKPKVIIIGAGFAGLSAAYKLKQKNVDFLILEARSRTGGRVFSHTMDEKENLVIELGAEWVGKSHERVIALCNEMKLELQNNQFDTRLIYKGKYHEKNEWDYSEEWNKKFKQLLHGYTEMNTADKKELDKIDWWRYLVNNGCDGRDLDLRELLDSTDFGESIRHVSAFAALAEYAESSEKNEMDFKIKGGNSMLAKKLAEKIGADKIKTGYAVTRIVQNTSGVQVFCKNGEMFAAAKIICCIPTFSLTKIKWEPALPAAKQTALNELQYARINKNPFLFTDRFWKDESFDMITDGPGHYFYHATKNQPSQKGVIISYTIGDKADVISKQNEEWKKNTVLEGFEHWGNVKSMLEKQTNYYWGEDDYSKGAYALYKPGQWFRIMPGLKKPFLHTVFAGEHLAEWQGFMEGAINTGEDAAVSVM